MIRQSRHLLFLRFLFSFLFTVLCYQGCAIDGGDIRQRVRGPQFASWHVALKMAHGLTLLGWMLQCAYAPQGHPPTVRTTRTPFRVCDSVQGARGPSISRTSGRAETTRGGGKGAGGEGRRRGTSPLVSRYLQPTHPFGRTCSLFSFFRTSNFGRSWTTRRRVRRCY